MQANEAEVQRVRAADEARALAAQTEHGRPESPPGRRPVRDDIDEADTLEGCVGVAVWAAEHAVWLDNARVPIAPRPAPP